MSRLISIDPGLTKVKTYLNERGYEIMDMEECHRPVEAVVYSGASNSNQGTTYHVAQNTILVNVAGLTPEEVEQQLENRLS